MGRQMGFLGQSRVWRAIMLACGLAWFGSVSGLKAETLASAPAASAPSTEPFALPAAPRAPGSVHQRWLGFQHRSYDDIVRPSLCDCARHACAAPAALRLLATVGAARQHEGRARLGEINRGVTLDGRTMSDGTLPGET